MSAALDLAREILASDAPHTSATAMELARLVIADHAGLAAPSRRAGETVCDHCGDESNSTAGLQCGRVEPESWVGPCKGVYR